MADASVPRLREGEGPDTRKVVETTWTLGALVSGPLVRDTTRSATDTLFSSGEEATRRVLVIPALHGVPSRKAVGKWDGEPPYHEAPEGR